MKLGTFRSPALVLACSLIAAGAVAQDTGTSAPATGLDIPADPQFLGEQDPTVRKATAIVNGDVITGTDIDHRLAMILYANGGRVPADQLEALRQQILRNLVDETLQIQAAEQQEMTVEPAEIDQYYARYAQSFQKTPQEFPAFLDSIGSSEASVRREIEAGIAWQRLQGRQIEPYVNVAEDEVQAVIDKLNASKGQSEYRVSEIFLSSTPATAEEVQAKANAIVDQIRRGPPTAFAAYAGTYSEASTRAVNGDLGWVQADQLPDILAEAVRVLPVGQVSNPIPVSGGYSILEVADTRKILTADPRNAVLSLKQMTVTFPAGTSPEQAAPAVERLTQTSQSMGGCGGAEAAAAEIGAEVVSNDQIRVRDLPGPLQEMLLNLSIGQATAPFGSTDERVSVLVLCGRDDQEAVTGPSFDQVYAQLEEQRINMRAQRYLRDLRRDAVVDYR